MRTLPHVQTDFSPSDQAPQLIKLKREMSQTVVPFRDNLEHLKALEEEARLIIALALLRRAGPEWHQEASYVRAISLVGLNPGEASFAKLNALLNSQKTVTLAREQETVEVELMFRTMCKNYGLVDFDRSAVLILLMLDTSRGFAEMFYLCGFEKREYRNAGMRVGSLLSIICTDYQEELRNRVSFSVSAPLMRQEILLFEGTVDDTANILEETVCLHGRFVRFVLGDNNLYSTAFKFIRRERSQVRLEQVVLSEEIKMEVVTHVGNYLMRFEGGANSTRLHDFFGYGTGLTLLFHGPSGTGKTMLAQALAHHFDRQLFSLTVDDMRRMSGSYEEILSTLFREASLHGAIVFFDESDDLFENNSAASRSLLIEIEKARCVVILATNKPVDLDPAMARRISLRVQFRIPDAALRRKMWLALLPEVVELAPDVNLDVLAERHLFTGGLIKNSIFMAVNSAMAVRKDAKPVVTREMLEHAAQQQSLPLDDASGICRLYVPKRRITELSLPQRQREELRNTSLAYERMKKQGLGLNVLISGADIETGIHVVEALAAECGLKVREFSYQDVIASVSDNKLMDPVTQRMVAPMDYAFSIETGDASLLLFVDREGIVAQMIECKPEKQNESLLAQLNSHLRINQGFFCLITRKIGRATLPVEFSLHFQLEFPPEEQQIRRWEYHTGGADIHNDELVSLVEKYPMHEAEIDFIARQAAIQSIIQGRSDQPSMSTIREVIARYRQKGSTPVLFGGN